MIYIIWGEESQIKIKIWLRYKVSGGCVMFFPSIFITYGLCSNKSNFKKKINVFHSEVELNLE